MASRITLIQRGPCRHQILPAPPDRPTAAAEALLYAEPGLATAMDPAALEQILNVAGLPGCVSPALIMPDGHAGYGFPIGGVAAFDPGKGPGRGGIVSAGGVGFDIACGVRSLVTDLTREDILSRSEELAEALYAAVPSGVGSGGVLKISDKTLDAVLEGGAAWAVGRGHGLPEDLGRIEENGRMPGAEPGRVSAEAKKRGLSQLGSLGSGNHYLEIQWVEAVLDAKRAKAYGLHQGRAVVSIHCGSRGLGHQVCQDSMARMKGEAKQHKLDLKDPHLACAPANSDLGREYLGAMRAAINFALANRQVIGQAVRGALDAVFPGCRADLLYDVSHNTCKAEQHLVGGKQRTLLVHRKGATRAWGPGHAGLPRQFQDAGQPVLLGGSMGTPSYVLAGLGLAESFASAPHGAGRALSRTASRKMHKGRDLVDSLAHQGILIRTGSLRSVAEEAPAAYKDVEAVVRSAQQAGLAVPVARLRPILCVKG